MKGYKQDCVHAVWIISTVYHGTVETKQQGRAGPTLRSSPGNKKSLPFLCSLDSALQFTKEPAVHEKNDWIGVIFIWFDTIRIVQDGFGVIYNQQLISQKLQVPSISCSFFYCQVMDRLISTSSWRFLDQNCCRLKREKASWAAQ